MAKVGKKWITADIIAAISLFLLCGFVIWESSDYPVPEELRFGGGPGIYPRILAISVAVLTAFLLVEIISRGKSKSLATVSHKEPKRRTFLVAFTLALAIAYWFLLPVLGFLFTTFMFLLTSMWSLSHKKAGWLQIITRLLCSAGITAFVYIVFQMWINIPLP